MSNIITFLVRYRVRISFFFAFFYFIAVKPSQKLFIPGIIIIFFGELLRTWSSGYIKKNSHLTTTGPYSVIRNPLYLGNLIIGLGFAIISNSILWILIFLLSFFIIYVNLIKKEEIKLSELFGDEFSQYKIKVPMLIPNFKNIKLNGSFEKQLLLEHKEWKAWSGIIILLVILYIKMTYFL